MRLEFRQEMDLMRRCSGCGRFVSITGGDQRRLTDSDVARVAFLAQTPPPDTGCCEVCNRMFTRGRKRRAKG